ncbi:hypothetical protein F0344_10260 [Streptomyces finlayi]|uniref:Uncharacterized protein n=1 Tax=Streptomyces finlayi TaxID=67296 RepID=A0A7G7BHY2_9ACTN|nr:hypothetical protein [Streptomyces finlayi]QNE74947.1 hypothetical protein F0344_10260 [Streptomyces finlayi]
MVVSALKLIASCITSGRLHGIGIGSTLGELQQAINCEFVDVVNEGSDSMRRDYGFIEFYLNSGQNWTVSGGSIELHRLAARPHMADRCRIAMREDFPQYLTWDELYGELCKLPYPPVLQKIDQGDFLEYRASATRVSVLVNNDHEERDGWLGHGDVWSVSLG